RLPHQPGFPAPLGPWVATVSGRDWTVPGSAVTLCATTAGTHRLRLREATMQKTLLVPVLALGLAGIAMPAAAAPWVRGYVVDAYEPAFFFGGKLSQTDLGTDCPKGANPDND